jgi:hypothetical protein
LPLVLWCPDRERQAANRSEKLQPSEADLERVPILRSTSHWNKKDDWFARRATVEHLVHDAPIRKSGESTQEDDKWSIQEASGPEVSTEEGDCHGNCEYDDGDRS